jgi:hypothetical protein
MARKKTPGKRGRPAGKPLTRKELAARRKNLRRARSAPKDLIYRPTARRMAANLKNLRKAIAARRREEANERVRLNALRHGVFSRELVDESVERLGESRVEYAAHHELFARMLVPRTQDEAVIVWELANLAWRRLRLFRAATERERRELGSLLDQFPTPVTLTADETLERMYLLFATLDGCDRVVREAAKLRSEMQDYFRLLIGRRSPAGTEEKLANPRWDPPEKYGLPESENWEGPDAQDAAESLQPAQRSDDPFTDLEADSEGN